MLIRKLFKYEASHQVFDAYSRRCSHSVHGHSYIAEFIFEGRVPDNAQMVADFGLIKKYFHPLVDSFDHSHILWNDERYEIHNAFFTDNNERWVSLPFNSTAEMQAKMFYIYGRDVLRKLSLKEIVNEHVRMHSVKVHETDTGYAEFRDVDYHCCHFPRVCLKHITFSEGIKKDWPEEFKNFYYDLIESC